MSFYHDHRELINNITHQACLALLREELPTWKWFLHTHPTFPYIHGCWNKVTLKLSFYSVMPDTLALYSNNADQTYYKNVYILRHEVFKEARILIFKYVRAELGSQGRELIRSACVFK